VTCAKQEDAKNMNYEPRCARKCNNQELSITLSAGAGDSLCLWLEVHKLQSICDVLAQAD
jgi:hypothetical protein